MADIFVVRFAGDGRVVGVAVLRSTGHALIDAKCQHAFPQWRCRHGVYSTIKVPAKFDFSG